MSPRTRDFLKYVPGTVSSAFVRKFANRSKSIPPDVLESLTSEERIAAIVAVQLLITERKIKNTQMIMRTIVIVAVLTACVVADPRIIEVVAEPLYEFLKVWFGQ